MAPSLCHIKLKIKIWAVAVAQLAEWSLPTLEISSSNPYNLNNYLSINFKK